MGWITSNADLQRETNEVNFRMNELNNLTNKEIAESANNWNWANLQAQNLWNIEQWNRENDYNSPSAQVTRLIQAGINPVSGLAGVQSTPAAHLESGEPQPAAVPVMNANHADAPQRALSSFSALGDSLVNGAMSVQNFLLKKQETKSSIKKTEADTALIQSQTETQQFTNKVNSQTFSVIVGQKQAEFEKVHQEIEKLKSDKNLSDSQKDLVVAQSEKENALKSQLIAATKKIENETFDKAVNLYGFLTDIRSRARQAGAAEVSAQGSLMSGQASLQNAVTNQAQLTHQIEKDEKEFSLKSNDQILEFLKFNRGKFGEMFGTNKNALPGSMYSPEILISNIIAAGKVLYNRYYSNPYDTNNFKSVERYNELMRVLDIPDLKSNPSVYDSTPAMPSVQNPIGESEKW